MEAEGPEAAGHHQQVRSIHGALDCPPGGMGVVGRGHRRAHLRAGGLQLRGQAVAVGVEHHAVLGWLAGLEQLGPACHHRDPRDSPACDGGMPRGRDGADVVCGHAGAHGQQHLAPSQVL